ncbi:MAG TPA: TonB-dependent receptor [Steroidobacteraceae bacterium]|nr:TonB-dependent receptor [Steroidobacteraceae bacterium]
MKMSYRLAPAVMAVAAILGQGGAALAAAEPSQALEEVVVTGSRIATTELDSFVPITVVNSAAIEATGTINIATSLRDLPSVGTSVLSTANSNFLTSDQGVNTINLRNLGDSRTLVLVNGRRMTPGVSGTTQVDLNTIPTEFIERVEIVTGGASAIYGSDAVAGAVNIIYKKNLDGLTLQGQAGQSGYNDAGNYTFGLTFGNPFADGRGQFMLNVSHDKDQGLRSASRKFTSTDETVTSSGLVNPQYSSYTPQGNFFVNSLAGGYSNEFSFGSDGSLIDGGGGPGYNRSSQRLITVPIERTLVASTMSYDLTDHHHAYAELTYADSHSHSSIEPTPLEAEGVNSVYGGANGGAVDANGDTIGMPISNAYLQTLPALAPIVSEINAWNSTGANCVGTAATNPAYDCINYLDFRRRLSDIGIGDRGNDSTRQTYRIVLGAKGDLPFGDWTYDASYVYGRTTDAQISHGGVNVLNFRQALNSVVDASGKIVCADPVAVAQGCVPINVFGVNSITPAAAAYVGAAITRAAEISEEVTTASISGTIGELPAGKPTLVFGTEFRKDSSSEIWDPLTNQGLNASNQLPNVQGSISVKEVFTEVEVPLLKDLPFVKSLGLNGAFREADYSTSGHVDTWKLGFNWAVIPDLRFRGVYSRAVRAANVGELYGGVAQTFPSSSDPCDGISATGNGNTTSQIAAACRTIPGVAAAIAGGGTFAYSALDTQQIFGLQGSNPNLTPEKSKTITAGFVLTPTILPGFSMTVDYFDVKVSEAVASINFDTSIQDCLVTGQPTFCGNVVRNATTGKIVEVLQLNLNIGYIRSTGIDTAVRYDWDLSSTPIGGKLGIDLAETHQLKLEQAVPGAPVEVDLGQLNSTGRLGAGFRDRASLMLDYQHGPFEASWKVNYLSSIQDTLPQNGILFQEWNNVPAYVYHDVQARYTYEFSNKTKLTGYLGANNVFNKKPPFLPGSYASNVTGTNTAADSYDVIGVFLYAGFKVKF